MNILFIDQFSDPGGAQLCLIDLMPEIKRRGWNPQIMAPGSGELLKWSCREGIPTHALPLRRYSNGRKAVVDFLRRHEPIIEERLAKKERTALPEKMPAGMSKAHGAAVVDFCHMLINANEFVYTN